ncbi:DUF4388 domain-containing protein [Chloroflexales bacterium ZM16-3]|nr:DUF4388 domain-containing protein [Chloroflexales bacterium ZM16-3]
MGLEGKLSDMPALDLLRVFQRGGNNGKLFVWTETLYTIVWFREGQAVSAVVLSRTDLRPLFVGEHAIFDLFTWPDGSFRFAPIDNAESYPVMIKQPTSALIIKALQQRSAAPARRPGDGLTMQTSLQIMTQMAGLNEHIHMTIEEWFVLTHIGPQATVETVVKAAGLPIERVLMALQHLIDSGLVMHTPLANLPTRQLTATMRPALTRAIRQRLQQFSA